MSIELGKLIYDSPDRDAIHIAVVPMVAGEGLAPGDRVFVSDGAAFGAGPGANGIGIVDPFLKRHLKKDDKFWLIMNPGTVANLRHTWTSAALPDESKEPQEEEYYDECAGC